jgi:choline dehydrogenase
LPHLHHFDRHATTRLVRKRFVRVWLARAWREIFAAPAFGRFAGKPMYPSPAPVDDNEAADHVRRYAESLYHPVGTCMMGNGQYAVVDADLRVHGLERLRVVDASVMPTIPRGHTHASTVMIAEKASDLIRESVPDRAP